MKHIVRRVVIRRDNVGWYTVHYLLGLKVGRRPHTNWDNAVHFALDWTCQ